MYRIVGRGEAEDMARKQNSAGIPVPQPDQSRQETSVYPLWLQGWERYSAWGFDAGTGSYCAELYRNTDDPDGPPVIRLSARMERYHLAPLLFARIVQVTGAAATEVYEAMLTDLPDGVPDVLHSPADPVAPGVSLADVESELDNCLLRFGGDETEAGMIDALQWVLGLRPDSPSGTVPRGGARPSPIEIAAEAWSASAAIYQKGVQPRVVGAENALFWVIGWMPD